MRSVNRSLHLIRYLLKFAPRLVERSLSEARSALSVLWEDFGGGGEIVPSELVGYGPVDEVQVEVVHFEILQGLLQPASNVLSLVVSVPELRGEEEILALDFARGDDLVQGLADLLLVLIRGTEVERAVAKVYGLLDGLANHSLRC